MASRIMHYAISIRLANELKIKDFSSFAIGNLAPDMICDCHLDYLKSHFINTCDHDSRNVINWANFIEKYGHSNMDSDFLLGYFIHLISDAYWSEIIQTDYLSRFPIEIQADILEQSYRDMKKCNIPLIQHYELEYNLQPVEIPKIEEMNPNFFEEVINALKTDFDQIESDEVLFEILNFDVITAYIERVTEICLCEVQQLKWGNH